MLHIVTPNNQNLTASWTQQRKYEWQSKERWPTILAPDAIRQRLWEIPGVDINYAPPAVFPLHPTFPFQHPSWTDVTAGLLDMHRALVSALGPPTISKAELEHRLTRQLMVFDGTGVGQWYHQNLAARPWYVGLLERIVSSVNSIHECHGPVLAILFLVSIAASHSVPESVG